MERPTIPDSASGVSITLSSPNLSTNPLVTRKTLPPYPRLLPESPHVRHSPSPAEGTGLRPGQDSDGPSLPLPLQPKQQLFLLLLQMVGHLRVHMSEYLFWRRGIHGLKALHGIPHPLIGGLPDRLFLRIIQQPLGPHIEPQSEKRILGLPLRHILRFPIPPGVIGRGVVAQPVRVGLNQGGTLAATSPFQGFPGSPIDGKNVVAVHLNARHTVADSLLGHRAGSGLLMVGH